MNTMPGDVNFDEIVNILDIITTVSIIMGTIDPDPSQFSAADLNGDGRLEIVVCAERGSLELRWWRNEGREVR